MPASRATSTSSTSPGPTCGRRSPRPGAELVAWARTAGAQEHALLADYASSDRAGAGSFE